MYRSLYTLALIVPLKLSFTQVAEVLRSLERTARKQQAAATAKASKAAERMAAELIEEEEREQAALAKVRVAPPSPHIGLHSVQLGGESDAAFLSHG
jgi:hypothetical protein